MIDKIVPKKSDSVTARKKPKKRFGFWRVVSWLFGSATILAVVVFAAIAIFLIQLTQTLPSAENMKNYEPPITTRIHAGDGSLMAEFARERRLFVPLDGIPKQVIDAFLAAEDKNFYLHPGVDFRGVVRAAIANIDNIRNNRRLEGASTITQQVARNFLLTSEVSFDRKIKEALIALRMEQTFSKERILELYLNEIYLGWRSYGVAAAALNYFDKSLEQLTLAEAAYLAALPKAPNNYHPTFRTEAAIERRNWVLERMVANGFITRAMGAVSKQEELVTFERAVGAQLVETEYFAEEVRRQLYDLYDEEGLYDGGLSVRTSLDPNFQKLARNSLRFGLLEYDRRHGWRGPHTRIAITDESWQEDLSNVSSPSDLTGWQKAIVLATSPTSARLGFEDGKTGELPLSGMTWARPWLRGENVGPVPGSVEDILDRGDVIFVEAVSGSAENSEEGWSSAKTLELRQIPEVNGAIVAMDPHTGRVYALVGGFSFEGSEFNRATQAMRQPGSAFKPIVYSAALDHGYTPASIVLDGPLVVDQGPGLPLWKPKNYSAEFYGESTLRTGIEQSRNLMTARLALDMGMDPIVEYARRLGVKKDLQPRPAMALGAGETTLFRMVAAYSVFVNGGKKVTPTLIDRIQDRYGKSIYRHDERTCEACIVDEWASQGEPLLPDNRELLLDPRTAYQVVSLLEGAVLRGTGRRMRALGKPLAGKTGTTNESRDAWFMSFTPDLIVGAYVGFDTPRSLGPGETGGRVALPVVQKFFEGALANAPGIPFRIPSGIRLVRINGKTGRLASPGDSPIILEAFKPGTEPTRTQGSKRVNIGAGQRTFGAGQQPGAAGNQPVQSSAPDGSSLSSGTGGLY